MSGELHPPPEILADYASGALDEARREPVREHLAECRHCTRIVLDLTAPEESEERRSADPELAAAWRAHLVRRARDVGHRDRIGAKSRARWRRVPSILTAASLVALALLTGVLAGRYWPVPTAREGSAGELRRPVLAVPGLELLPEGSLRTGAPEPRIAAPRDAALLTLTLVLLDPSELSRSGRYELVIHRASGGTTDDEEVWRGTGRTPEDPERSPDTLTVVVPPGFLEPGRYRLVLRKPGSSGASGILASYRFRLSPPGETAAPIP
jgi:hypothetical protein